MAMTSFKRCLDCARSLDREDPLAHFRAQFFIPQHEGKDSIYLTGNSLGLQPKLTRQYIENELDLWETLAVEAHLKGKYPWLSYHEVLTESLSRLAGGLPSEVVAMNSLTVNLHLMMVSFYRPETIKNGIVIESGAFSSDRYAVQSQAEFHGYPNAVMPFPETSVDSIDGEALCEFIDKNHEKIALVLLGQPNYRTGQAFEIGLLSKLCQKNGIVFGVDLAHGIGNLELSLHDWGVDFAVWCSYKYLNAGPGAIAGCFVHERHHKKNIPRFAGWWGGDKTSRFEMVEKFKAIPTVEAWQISNPPIFQAAALRASLAQFEGVGMGALRKKSELLTGFMEFLCQGSEAKLITPTASSNRGCQLSFRHPRAARVVDEMKKGGIVADFRFPDVVRAAPVPLYNTFEDVWKFSGVLCSSGQK